MEKTKINYKKLGFFRFRKIGQKILITNDVGSYIFLEKKDFDNFIHDKLEKNAELYGLLKEKHFIAEEIDLEKVTKKYKKRKSFIEAGPSLHIMVLTKRCNYECSYCHASIFGVEKENADMTEEVALKSLEIIFSSSSKNIAIEFQGGEPTLNWPMIEFVIEKARQLSKTTKKELEFRLVTNFSLFDDKKLDFLIKNKVNICTSFDGPKEIHNKNRGTKKIDSYKITSDWIKKASKKLKAKKMKLSSIPTISKISLKAGKGIVDEYIKHGFNEIFLKPLNPYGIKKEVWQKMSYSAEEFLKFYLSSLDYIINLNLKGKKVVEKTAQIYLQKILTDTDPNYLELRSPCGAGIGQIAYDFNGDVYTCDEGRMLAGIGDESFKIGNVLENSYEDIVTHTTVRTLCTASCLDNLASCSDCAFLPYCGVCPIYNYFEQGNIYAQMARSERCKISLGILDFLLQKLEDKKINDIFTNWIK